MSLANSAVMTATTNRGLIVNGKRQAPTTYLSGIACTRPNPAGQSSVDEIRTHVDLKSPFSVRETFVPEMTNNVTGLLELPDVAPGDVLTVLGSDYMVHSATPWVRRNGSFLRILMESAE